MLCHDPGISNNRNEKRETSNAALMQAERIRRSTEIFRMSTGRDYKGPDDIDWEYVAEMADICDLPADMNSA